MFELFAGAKDIIKISSIKIDNKVFQLHYKATVAILVVFSAIITSNQYIGDPIDCMADEIPTEVMDTYCWIYSTFTVPEKLTGRVGKDVIHPGVAPTVDGEDDVKFHKYYQWVCFVLIFQAILFYAPHYIWKQLEGQRIKRLADRLRDPIIQDKEKEEEKDQKIIALTKYFKENTTYHSYYVAKFIFCEVLNFVNVLGQIFFMDYFLDGEFTSYGLDVISMTDQDPEERIDPMSKVFPKITKCTFYKYGPSGTVQKFDGLCVLPLNIVNEKIYVFLWFWFVILSAITGLALVYRVLTYFIPYLRGQGLNVGSLVKSNELNALAKGIHYGDWFVLQQVAVNADPVIFKDLIESLKKKILNEDIKHK